MNDTAPCFQTLLLFDIERKFYALQLNEVERVIRAVAVTPVPELPPQILGLVNGAGKLGPGFSLRACLGLSDRPVGVFDQFMLVRTRWSPVALVADDGVGVPADLFEQSRNSLGLQLVQDSVRKFEGKHKILPGNGSHFEITFKAKLHRSGVS